jgi:hypothetical protein
MVLKSAFAAAICTGFLALGTPAMADEYRPSEFLGLDLSKAVLSPKRLGPQAEFAPIPIEAKSDAVRPWLDFADRTPVRETHVVHERAEPRRAEPPRTTARVKLAQRHGNPLDAQARDTRIQTWPCKSGAMCGWQR